MRCTPGPDLNARAQAWVMVGQQMYGVPLRVQRTFYVDSDLAPEEAVAAMHWKGAHVSQAKRTLPHSRQAGYLYQVSRAAAEASGKLHAAQAVH